MNERIRELAVQAGFDINTAEQHLNSQMLPHSLERFAKLVAQDCLGIYDAIDNGNTIEGTDNYMQAIRQRYGQ